MRWAGQELFWEVCNLLYLKRFALEVAGELLHCQWILRIFPTDRAPGRVILREVHTCLLEDSGVNYLLTEIFLQLEGLLYVLFILRGQLGLIKSISHGLWINRRAFIASTSRAICFAQSSVLSIRYSTLFLECGPSVCLL